MCPLAGPLTSRDPSGERVIGNWIYRGVMTAKLVIVTCFSLDGTEMVLFVTMNGKVKVPLHIGKLTLDSSYLKTYTCTKGKLNYLLQFFLMVF